ncbi:hypothetical protein SBA1_250007 [Candidatus Sulfotelmatobacter kueseliae]|uniref:Uncharacterized protein n=1 Tax=Candidatus Sulfotelmatobacter kueseliae TaxID=2042962 RepID=A0A2U3KHQ7_9BACT|nr:hypothetical protein SBA1_250007 [Candidatus Sulfotelmatobacter kueseliae]
MAGPQGLKPGVDAALDGPAEAGPYPKPICETSSSLFRFLSVTPCLRGEFGLSRHVCLSRPSAAEVLSRIRVYPRESAAMNHT